jgi:hypothetical protein
VLQYFLSPLLIAHGFFPALLSNLLFMVAISYYHYLNFLGYDGKFILIIPYSIAYVWSKCEHICPNKKKVLCLQFFHFWTELHFSCTQLDLSSYYHHLVSAFYTVLSLPSDNHLTYFCSYLVVILIGFNPTRYFLSLYFR